VQFPAWLCLSLFVFTYLLSCALKLNDDDDDDDDDDVVMCIINLCVMSLDVVIAGEDCYDSYCLM